METPRETLISNFSDGKSPTGSQFKMLIESIVSRQDDGMDKGADTPLKVAAGKEAHAPAMSLCPKDVLDPQWVLSLKAGGKEGLNFGQGDTPIHPVLFLDKATGRIGMGTNEPVSALEIQRSVNAEAGLLLHNPHEGSVAYVIHRLKTLGGEGVIFKNSSARTVDGGPNAMTVRNDAGDLRLQSAEQRGSVTIKGDSGFVGVNNPNPAAGLDVNGSVTFNGHSIYFPAPGTVVGDLNTPGIFWHGANFGNDTFKHGIYKTGGPWTSTTFQQLRIQFDTGLQLGAGTGAHTGYSKSYVEIVNGKGLMVTSGKLAVGTVNPAGKGHVVTASSNGDVGAWDLGQFVVGQEAASGANSGGLGISYHTATATSFLSSLSPGTAWRDLGLRALNTIFYVSGGNEAMRLTADGKLGIGTNAPALQLQVRRDANEGMGMHITNMSGGAGAFAIAHLQTDAGVGVLFKNSSTRSVDGGPNTMTLRNDNGDLRLQSQGGLGLQVKAGNGFVALGMPNALAPLSINGEGKKETPDGAMHISRDCILFGGPNNSNCEWNSAQISAGRHQAHSLCIVGMSDQNKANRRVDIWAEGGMILRGGALGIGTSTPPPAALSIYTDGKKDVPDGGMHITRDCILFGGNNTGRDGNSAQISAGKHIANSLNIVGMSSGPSWTDRRIDAWVEGGWYQYGPSLHNSGINNATARPAVTKNRIFGEIAGYSSAGLAADDGFLRLSAGGGTSAGVKAFIDLSGYSTLPEMHSNLVLGTSGVERLRVNHEGKVGIGTTNPFGRMHVASNGKVVDGNGLLLGRINDQIKTSSTPGELLGVIEIGFAGWRDSEPNQIGAKISAMRIANYGAPNAHLVQATELAFFTSTGAIGPHNETLHETCYERLRINKDGKVGIGTLNPQYKLQVNGGDMALYASDDPAGQNSNGYANLGTLFFYGHGRNVGNDSARITCGSPTWDDQGYLAFCTSNDGAASTEKMRIGIDGKIGIGTATPAGKLHVITASSDGNVGNWDAGQFVVGREAAGGGNSGGIGMSYSHTANTSYISSLSPNVAWRDLAIRCNHTYFLVNGGSEVLRVHNNSCVGIGHGAPPAPLSIGFGHGKEEWPDSSLHITNDCILFGGNNNAREANSAQISAGKHHPNSLNLVGMSTGADAGTRRVDMWAEGGFNVYGRLGVGLGAMQYASYPIQVNAVVGNIPGYSYLNRWGTGTYNATATAGVSIWCADRVIGSEFNAISDIRTKTNITVSDGKDDLNRLMQVQISSYNYRDYVSKGTAKRKGLIAQQVKEVYPEAVATHTEFVPDIFSNPAAVEVDEQRLTITMETPHGMKSGDLVRLYSKNGFGEKEVKVKNKKTFTLEDWTYDTDELFIYGKKVDDFMVVDYDRFFTLGLSATQELSRQVDALKAQNETLLQELAAIKQFLKMG